MVTSQNNVAKKKKSGRIILFKQFITKASTIYNNKLLLRAAIKAIPKLGSSLDTIFAGLGSKYQYKRLENFIDQLSHKIAQLQTNCIVNEIEPTEELFDFIIQVFDQVIKTRSEEKRERLANLVTNQIACSQEWNEAETACRLIGELTENHLRVLILSLNAKTTTYFHDNCRLVRISKKDKGESIFEEDSLYLNEFMPNISEMALRMLCSELVSKGLMKDIGIGFGHSGTMTLFAPTELADWLANWINAP